MKKLTIGSMALLGMSVMATSVQANDYYVDYSEAPPAKASLNITLSGACSAKINVPVVRVEYGSSYSDNDASGILDKNSSQAYLNFKTADNSMYVAAFNGSDSLGQKISQSVKKGTRSVSANFVGTGYYDVQAIFDSLASGGYDSQIKCKDGLTLQQQMMPSWTSYYDAMGNKTSGSIVHTNATSNASVGSYKAKFTSTGNMETPSQCVLKGVLNSTDYSFVCTQAKRITIKVTATAQGDSTLVP